jgi:integrase
MRLYRPTYRDKKTKQIRQVKKWWVELRDHLQLVRRFPAFTDKGQSRILGQQIQKLVACRMAGQQPDPELARWLEQVPSKWLRRFVEIGLLDTARAAGQKLLKDHLADFRNSLIAKGDTKMHVQTLTSRARRIIDGCGFRKWSDMRADMIERYLADLRERGLSVQTSNFYLQSVQQFARWMVQNRRASESPVAHLKPLNVRTDRRRDRIPLEVDEVRRLLSAAEKGPERYGMSGQERALLYRLAVETGLRRKELRSLRVSSFDYDSNTVTVVAGYSKRRREDVLPLRAETATDLKVFFAGKLPTAKAFGGRYKQLTDKTAPMIRADLAEAGIDYMDDAGRYRDFHALRHTTGSWLAANGVHPKVAQAIMRHSDINLTMSRYTHIFRGQEAAAIAKLPDLSAPDRQTQKATGTYGKPVDANSDLAENLAFLGAGTCSPMLSGAETTGTGAVRNGVSKANGRIRTDNPWFTKPELYR